MKAKTRFIFAALLALLLAFVPIAGAAQTPAQTAATQEVEALRLKLGDFYIVYGKDCAVERCTTPASNRVQRERLVEGVEAVVVHPRFARTMLAEWLPATPAHLVSRYNDRAGIAGRIVGIYLGAKKTLDQERASGVDSSDRVRRNELRTEFDKALALMRQHAFMFPNPDDSPLDAVTHYELVREIKSRK